MLLPKRSTILATLAGLTLTALMLPSAWALDDEAQAAKDEGMRLWGISEWIGRQPPISKFPRRFGF